jgi:RNA polymerase sigma-70 factor (ECF subfamily)
MSKSEKPSFEALALPELELVYRVARRLCGRDDEAEDLVQETYLKAYKSYARFELREYGIRPWLLRILNNTYLNRRTREARAPSATDQQVLEEQQPGRLLAAADDFLPQLDYEQLDGEVKAAIDGLASDFRTVLLLWATQELSYQEIAETLEIPIGTVMSRLHRARRQLRTQLSDFARQNRLAH